MKRILILFLAMVLLLVSCQQKPRYWEFERNFSEVTEIKIVDVSAGHYYSKDYEIIKELDIGLVEELYNDIEAFEMKKYGTNLKTPRGKCFMIVFANGEYDLISEVEPKRFRYDENGNLQAYNSWLKSDTEAFAELIDKYLNKTYDTSLS